jgi:sulfur-oxidizing protein SoxA
MNFIKYFSIFSVLFFYIELPAQVIRQSGNYFLSPEMRKLQEDATTNPTVLWIDQGQELWNANCVSCHQSLPEIAKAVVHFPKLKTRSNPNHHIWNIEDQIMDCYSKNSKKNFSSEDQDILALSVFLSDAAKGIPIQLQEPKVASEKALWQEQMNLGASIYVRRQGRLNLSCTQCHDQNIGKNLRSDVISPAYLTGFPIYRQSWQTVGSLDRRLRACYSGVQASVPTPKSPELRALELFLKKRSEGMLWEGPSLRR